MNKISFESNVSDYVFNSLNFYSIWTALDNQVKETLTEAINIGISNAYEFIEQNLPSHKDVKELAQIIIDINAETPKNNIPLAVIQYCERLIQ